MAQTLAVLLLLVLFALAAAAIDSTGSFRSRKLLVGPTDVEQPETAAEAFAQEPKQLRATIQAQMTAPKAHPEKAPAISGEAATADPGGGSSGATNADATPASEPAAATSGENPTSGGAANADWIDKFTKTCDATTKAAADKAAAAKSAAAKADKDAAEKAAADKAAKRLPKRAQQNRRAEHNSRSR